MRILVTADTIGGVWIYAKELITGLVRKGVQVTLVSFGELPSPAQADWVESPEIDYRPSAFRLEWMREAERDIDASQEFLMSVIEETCPDIVHLNQFCYGSLPISVPKILVAHSDVLSWREAVQGTLPIDVSWLRWYRTIVSEGLHGADAVVAPSKWMMEQLQRLYGELPGCSVIYNGRTPTLFNPHVTKDGYILTVGRVWDSGKQVNLVTQIEPPAPVFVIGDEQHADATLRGGSRLNNPKVFLKGKQTEAQLRHWYSRASIYAATSAYEPFGLAPLEAALSRCAIIANDIPSFREVWGDTAMYFERNNPSSLCQTLGKLHGDRQMRMQYANMAYTRARQRYTADRMVEQYLSLYYSLMNTGAIAA
jgi:glycogen(starch) synthase